MKDHLDLKAYAKINLGLDVVRKREDGYHEVRMIMQTVNLYDRIEMDRTEDGVIRTETNLPFVPDGEGNLAWRAAKLLLDEKGIKDGVTIKIRKYIPVAAGMAGGSTDAAAVLVGVNRMFDLGFTKKELMERGVKLGADVPYCIMRGTALSEGIGEILTELPAPPQCHLVIAKPQISVSTKAAVSYTSGDCGNQGNNGGERRLRLPDERQRADGIRYIQGQGTGRKGLSGPQGSGRRTSDPSGVPD